MTLELWQPVYEGYLQRAMHHIWEAEDELEKIGAGARKQALIDSMRYDLRVTAAGLAEVWKSHYVDDWTP